MSYRLPSALGVTASDLIIQQGEAVGKQQLDQLLQNVDTQQVQGAVDVATAAYNKAANLAPQIANLTTSSAARAQLASAAGAAAGTAACAASGVATAAAPLCGIASGIVTGALERLGEALFGDTTKSGSAAQDQVMARLHRLDVASSQAQLLINSWEIPEKYWPVFVSAAVTAGANPNDFSLSKPSVFKAANYLSAYNSWMRHDWSAVSEASTDNAIQSDTYGIIAGHLAVKAVAMREDLADNLAKKKTAADYNLLAKSLGLPQSALVSSIDPMPGYVGSVSKLKSLAANVSKQFAYTPQVTMPGWPLDYNQKITADEKKRAAAAAVSMKAALDYFLSNNWSRGNVRVSEPASVVENALTAYRKGVNAYQADAAKYGGAVQITLSPDIFKNKLTYSAKSSGTLSPDIFKNKLTYSESSGPPWWFWVAAATAVGGSSYAWWRSQHRR